MCLCKKIVAVLTFWREKSSLNRLEKMQINKIMEWVRLVLNNKPKSKSPSPIWSFGFVFRLRSFNQSFLLKIYLNDNTLVIHTSTRNEWVVHQKYSKETVGIGIYFLQIINSPILGMAMCMKWCSSWLFASSCRPSKSLSKTSWGTLHPHPLRSAKRVKRKWASKSWARGSKGLLIANALVLVGWPPASSNWAACWAACWAAWAIREK